MRSRSCPCTSPSSTVRATLLSREQSPNPRESLLIFDLRFIQIHLSGRRVRAGQPLPILRRLMDVYPEGARQRDEDGNLPLHLVLSLTPFREDVFDLVIETWPDAAQQPDEKQGRLPLHLAVRRNAPGSLSL